METRANHLLIGGFVLIVTAATFGFVIWLAKVDIDREFSQYHIYFEESVSGLNVGGDVRFNGIPVGTVTEIRIDPENPARVRVLVEVGSDTPVFSDTEASLQFQGITGISFVQLAGGSPDKERLAPKRKGDIPVIPSVRSTLSQLFAGAPELINRVILLVNRLTLLVNDENQARVSQILRNVDDLTSTLKEQAPEVERIVADFGQMSADLGQTVKDINRLIGRLEAVLASTDKTLSLAQGTLTNVDQLVKSADQLVKKDVRLLVKDLRSTAKSIDGLSREFNDFMKDNREPLDVFASQGLVEFTKFIEEARILIASATRLIDELQTDPAQFLFGRQRGGLETQ